MAFLLPCPQCGQKLVVTTGEAGGQMRCACGTPVDVPTVRGLRELEPAAASSAESAPSWTARHSVIFLGSVVAIAGLAFGLVQHFRAAALLPAATFADDVRTMAPAETWTIWTQFIRQGVSSWQPKKDEKQLSDLKAYDEIKRWEIIGFSLAGVGVVLAVIGVTMLGPKRPVPPKRPPRRPTTATGVK